MDSWTVMNTLCAHAVTIVFRARAYIHNRRAVLHTLVASHARTDICAHLVRAYTPILARIRQAVINVGLAVRPFVASTANACVAPRSNTAIRPRLRANTAVLTWCDSTLVNVIRTCAPIIPSTARTCLDAYCNGRVCAGLGANTTVRARCNSTLVFVVLALAA